MNDTHTGGSEPKIPADDAIEALAALDPADAPERAEAYAQLLTDELEQAGASAPPSEQLRADLEIPEG